MAAAVMRKIARAAMRSNGAIETEGMPSAVVLAVTTRSVSIAGMRAAMSARRSGMSVHAGTNGTLAGTNGMPAATSATLAVMNETLNAGATPVNIKRGNAGKRADTKRGRERKRMNAALGSEGKRASVSITAGASISPIGNAVAHATITVTTAIVSIVCDMSGGRS